MQQHQGETLDCLRVCVDVEEIDEKPLPPVVVCLYACACENECERVENLIDI